MPNTVLVSVKVRGVVREEEGLIVAGFPRLEIYSQGETVDEAKESARDALRLWFDSCIDRGTLADALRELGWHRTPEAQSGEPAEPEHIRVVHVEDALGEPWEDTINIPAFEAAELLATNA